MLRRMALVAAIGTAICTAIPANAMPVSTFVSKAEALRKKGPLALLSGDLKLLMGQVKQDAGELRAENKAAEANGTRKAFCASGPVKMDDKQIMAAMERVPAAQRGRVSTKDALRSYFAAQYPCS